MTLTSMNGAKKPKVMMVGHPTAVDERYWRKLEGMVDFHFVPQASHADSIALFRAAAHEHGPFVALIYMLEWGKPVPFPMDEALLAPLVGSEAGYKVRGDGEQGRGLRMASSPGAGYDRVDVEYLARHGVLFANNPISVGKRTADSTMMMIMQALRGSSEQERHLRAGLWADRALRVRDASVCTVGIVGLGNIGRQVARHCEYIGFRRIQYFQRTRLGREDERSYHYVSFASLLATSDVIVLMTPLTTQTRHLIGRDEFAQMKDGVIIVNTSRGAVIDEAELVEALNSGKVLRAALDVFENEPEIHPGLIDHPHTTLTPHVAVYGERLVYESQREILENLETFIKTGRPNTPVNG